MESENEFEIRNEKMNFLRLNAKKHRKCKLYFAKTDVFYFFVMNFLIASNDSSLILCSMLQASSDAVSAETPREVKKVVSISCRL